MSVPGLITAHDLVLATRAVLAAHLPAALTAVAGPDPVLPTPKTHEAPTAEALRRDAVELPVLVVSTPGMEGPLRRDELGYYQATWPVVVQFLVRSVEGTYGATQRDLHRYAAAVRTVLLEHPDLDGFAHTVEDVSEADYDEADPAAARTLAEGAVTCVVTVLAVADTTTPFTTAAPPKGTAATTTITVHTPA